MTFPSQENQDYAAIVDRMWNVLERLCEHKVHEHLAEPFLKPPDKTEREYDFSLPLERARAIVSYTTRWRCSNASLVRAANVHPADLVKWAKDELPPGSAKSDRIEKALRDDVLPKPAKQKPQA